MEQEKPWDWFTDFSEKVSRKRKYSDAMVPSSPVVTNQYYLSLCEENSMYPSKINKITHEAKLAEQSFDRVFQDKKLLKNILGFLSQTELGNSGSAVCKKWADTCNQIIKKRHGTRPFLLHWTCEHGENPLFYSITQQLKPFIYSSDESKAGTAIVFGTQSNWVLNPDDVDASLKQLKGMNYICGFFEHLWITHPTLLNAREITSGKLYGFQTLVIPESPTGITELRTFTVPIIASENPEVAKEFLYSLINSSNSGSRNGTLRGILLMEFCRDPFMDLLFTRGLEEIMSSFGHPMPFIVNGIIENYSTNSDQKLSVSTLASGFAIYGTHELEVVSLGFAGEQFYNHPEKMLQFYGQIHAFFSTKSNGFMVFYYKPPLAEDMKRFLRSLVPIVKVPIFGGSTHAPILVRGYDGASGIMQTMDPVVYDLTFLLVAY